MLDVEVGGLGEGGREEGGDNEESEGSVRIRVDHWNRSVAIRI